MKSALIATAIVLVSTTGALADRIDQRQANEAKRIEDGRRSGQLSGREYVQLKAEQARIANMERFAKADGVVTRHEARAIEDAQDAASRRIYQEKHDGDTARRHWYRRWW
ncbi:MAG: hypothetical protein ABL901_08170 [Hyphomicrobiaceae bacterium]